MPKNRKPKPKPIEPHQARALHAAAAGRAAAGRRPRTVIDDLTSSCYQGMIRHLGERQKKQEQIDRLRALTSATVHGEPDA